MNQTADIQDIHIREKSSRNLFRNSNHHRDNDYVQKYRRKVVTTGKDISFLGMMKTFIFILLAFMMSHHFSLLVSSSPLNLVIPDEETNTKLIVCEEGINFLRSLKESNIAVVAVAGRAKTGKSFLMNHLLRVDHAEGFPVQVSFKPGTKGISIWSEAFKYPKNGNKEVIKRSSLDSQSTTSATMNNHHHHDKDDYMTVVFIDSEGLGAPGNPAHSYDPKLASLTISLASLLIYNLNHEIQVSDINLLHSVATLSSVFENQFNETFPFPPILWTIQQYEHDLMNYTHEEYLDWVLQEKPNIFNTDEIRRYNETVRVVKQFPEFGKPRILLLNHPHKATGLPRLPSLKYHELDLEYQYQVSYLRQLIETRLRPKQFKHLAVSGEYLANLIESMVKHMNTLDTADVGLALIKELSFILKQHCLEQYNQKLHSIPLPQDLDFLQNQHEEMKSHSLDIFKKNCTGGLDLFGNVEYYHDLGKQIDKIFSDYLPNNGVAAFKECSDILSKLFDQYITKNQLGEGGVEQFDKAIEMMKQLYFQQAKGPNDIKQKVLKDFESNTATAARNRILDKTTAEDSTLAVFSLVLGTFTFYVLALIPKRFGFVNASQFLMSLCYFTATLTILIVLAWFNIMGLRFTSLSYYSSRIKNSLLHIFLFYGYFKLGAIVVIGLVMLFVFLKIYSFIKSKDTLNQETENSDPLYDSNHEDDEDWMDESYLSDGIPATVTKRNRHAYMPPSSPLMYPAQDIAATFNQYSPTPSPYLKASLLNMASPRTPNNYASPLSASRRMHSQQQYSVGTPYSTTACYERQFLTPPSMPMRMKVQPSSFHTPHTISALRKNPVSASSKKAKTHILHSAGKVYDRYQHEQD
ncbi:hypothetical protein C9374_002197 [Naegleria lovaniensis]|uniref:Guanylate binding protein n=1 Tax=Naegleria lovaniensis TaxID=51637 RepID=A0AA88KL74_NAELO|nr:uncharacterized protein C9374_002197 [Naegleria lovaniensis]KAG2386453.1 hypothetical protein C9374_002197 [Naegleria lovaniensis]